MNKLLTILAAVLLMRTAALAKPPATQPAGAQVPGEQIPSEDPVLKDFHSLGLIEGHANIYRAACPVADLAKSMATSQPSAAVLAEARARLKRMYDLGIRTDISFQSASTNDDHKPDVGRSIELEETAAREVGIRYVAYPMSNSGKNSLQDMSDAAVMQWLQIVSDEIFRDANSGGVVFHCSAGHDRAGIVAAFLRIKYEKWPVEQAIAEMRRLGHNWPKFSSNGGISSWHEEHLRAIAKMPPQ